MVRKCFLVLGIDVIEALLGIDTGVTCMSATDV